MATLIQKETLAQDATFQKQIKQQIITKAGTVLSSQTNSYKSINAYYLSINLANSIIASPASYVDRFAEACSAFGTFAGIATPVATDAEVSTAVNLVYPYLAGLTISDQ